MSVSTLPILLHSNRPLGTTTGTFSCQCPVQAHFCAHLFPSSQQECFADKVMGRKKEWFPTSRKNAAFFYYLENSSFGGGKGEEKSFRCKHSASHHAQGILFFCPERTGMRLPAALLWNFLTGSFRKLFDRRCTLVSFPARRRRRNRNAKPAGSFFVE